MSTILSSLLSFCNIQRSCCWLVTFTHVHIPDNHGQELQLIATCLPAFFGAWRRSFRFMIGSHDCLDILARVSDISYLSMCTTSPFSTKNKQKCKQVQKRMEGSDSKHQMTKLQEPSKKTNLKWIKLAIHQQSRFLGKIYQNLVRSLPNTYSSCLNLWEREGEGSYK